MIIYLNYCIRGGQSSENTETEDSGMEELRQVYNCVPYKLLIISEFSFKYTLSTTILSSNRYNA